MTTKPSQLRRFSAIVVLSLVHQLNAGACGCLEHNGWYQAARAALADHHGHGHGHGHEPHDAEVEHSHCEDHGGLVYLPLRSVVVQEELTGFCETPMPVIAASSLCCSGVTAGSIKEQSAASLAPDMRALTQVLLI